MSSGTETIPEIMSALKSSFIMAADLSKLEADLVAREEAMKEKLAAKEREVRIMKNECKILKGEVEDEEKAMEPLAELRDSNSQVLELQSQKILLLQRENCDLKWANWKAEEEVERYRGKLQEFEERCLILEKDLMSKAERYKEKFVELEQRTSMREKDLLLKRERQNANAGAAGCKRALPEGVADPTDICKVKKQKGPFQWNQHFPSISSTYQWFIGFLQRKKASEDRPKIVNDTAAKLKNDGEL